MDASKVWGIGGNWAEVYHCCFVPAMIAPWAGRTLALAAPRPGERVLDVACGSGVVTRCAAQAVGPKGRVVGLDISAEMLAVARSASGEDGLAAIEWHEGAADRLPFSDGSFDIVTCELGLMFFPDRMAALKEMRRVLAANGRIALMTWGALERCPGQAVIAQIWGEYIGTEQAAKLQPAHSLNNPEQVHDLLQAAGFAQIDVRTQRGSVHFSSPETLVCSYGALAGLEADAATRDALCVAASRLLQAYCSKDGLDYPVEAVLAWAY